MHTMCDWAKLPVWDYVFGFLKYLCGCGGGDVVVRLVCWGWRKVRVIRPVLKFCENCIDDLDGIFEGIKWGSVRKVVLYNFSRRVMCGDDMRKFMCFGSLREIVFGEGLNMCGEDVVDALVEFCGVRVLDLGGLGGLVVGKNLSWLSEFVDLVELNLRGMDVGILEEFGKKLVNLRKLNLSSCVNVSVDWIVSGIRELDLSNCANIDDVCLLKICGKMKQMRGLYLAGCRGITDAGVGEIFGKMRGLRSLSLSGLGRIGVRGVGRLEKLKWLDLSYLSVRDGIDELREMRWLKTLVLVETRVTDEDFVGMVWLRNLVLSGCRVTGVGLRGMGNLERLDLEECRSLTDEGFVVMSNLVSLKQLNLKRCEMSDERLKSLPVGLNRLIMGGVNCSGLDLGILGRLRNLHGLDLSECVLSDGGVEKLVALDGLEQLDLRNCESVTSRGMASVGRMVNLSKLNLCGCGYMDDEMLKNLGGLRWLESLGVSLEENVSIDDVLKILGGLRYLR